MAPAEQLAGPVQPGERVLDLDVLRGTALFGMFLVNMVAFANAGTMATAAQLTALPTAQADATLHFLIGWLFADKENTIFAFLFGLGFYLQMERATARGADFERIYLRRLGWLFLFGVLHALFLWTRDILHLYALAGFALFFLRRLSTRSMLTLGVPLAMFGPSVLSQLMSFADLDFLGGASPETDEAVFERQEASESGDYIRLIALFWRHFQLEWILSGALVGWFAYALGRFLIGAWAGRHGWLQHADRYLPGFRRVMWLTLPAGLLLALVVQAVRADLLAFALTDAKYWRFAASVLRPTVAVLVAAGYVCATVLALRTSPGHSLLAPFRHVGQMALTNYVMQSVITGVVLFGVGPGLALAGRIGTTQVTLFVIAGFAAQMIFSRLWLARFPHGPLEWAWRSLTYGGHANVVPAPACRRD